MCITLVSRRLLTLLRIVHLLPCCVDVFIDIRVGISCGWLSRRRWRVSEARISSSSAVGRIWRDALVGGVSCTIWITTSGRRREVRSSGWEWILTTGGVWLCEVCAVYVAASPTLVVTSALLGIA